MDNLPHRILLIDSYDSFTFNLASLCRQSIPNCIIHIIKNDQLTLSQLLPFLKYFSAVLVGPGPGSPDNASDVGLVKELWSISSEYVLPIFGVCLGLQSLAIEYGAKLLRLRVVKHGQISRIHHCGSDLFGGVGSIAAVRYHSLHVKLAVGGPIEQLAWADDGVENGQVVMSIKHHSLPFWAVQYHPESACTDGGGFEVLHNFWRLAQNWAKHTGRSSYYWKASCDLIGTPWPYINTMPIPTSPSTPLPTMLTDVLELPQLSVTTVCELLGAQDEAKPFVALDSAAQPGRFSIISSLTSTSLSITFFVGDSVVRLTRGDSVTDVHLGTLDVWSWLGKFMRSRKAQGGCADVPFWGGLIGFLSYEMGISSLDVPLKRSKTTAGNHGRHADLHLVFVERSVVMDSRSNKIYIQSIAPDDGDWIAKTKILLLAAAHSPMKLHPNGCQTKAADPFHLELPNKEQYISRIELAKEHLFAGDSYELCLTAPTRIAVPAIQSNNASISCSSSWERYKILRHSNPAPHSAYLRLHPTTFLSSSPERFLSFSRPPGTTYQLRPIKGTVRKTPEITRAIAEQLLLGSRKEVAENLMIVDLIRHDLHGVVGEDVHVKQFCGVEEYETVWQLVSIIEGKTPSTMSSANQDRELGWEVLRRSLPPGSMTGAPKKRSVEILQNLEENTRGIYSGVFGYWCVGGSGDWSVTIRSCFKFEDKLRSPASGEEEEKNTCAENWIIGAGGAITALSDPEQEWEEMLVKLQSVLRAFGVDGRTAEKFDSFPVECNLLPQTVFEARHRQQDTRDSLNI